MDSTAQELRALYMGAVDTALAKHPEEHAASVRPKEEEWAADADLGRAVNNIGAQGGLTFIESGSLVLFTTKGDEATVWSPKGCRGYTRTIATTADVESLGAPIRDTRRTHDCADNAVPTMTDGPLGHGWECGICGKFLQAG